MSKITAVLNNNWFAGIGAGLVVAALTSGLAARLDRSTIALIVVAAVSAGLAVWLLTDNRGLRARLVNRTGIPGDSIV